MGNMETDVKDIERMQGVLAQSLQKCKEVAGELEKYIEVTESVEPIVEKDYLFDNTANEAFYSAEVQLLFKDIIKTSTKLRDCYLELLSEYSALLSMAEGDSKVVKTLSDLNNVMNNEWRAYIRMSNTMLKTNEVIYTEIEPK